MMSSAFDVTRPPDVDIDAPIEQREPGGLGLHLIRRMADSVEYEYTKETRQSRITLRITGASAAARNQSTRALGERMLAIDFGPDGTVVARRQAGRGTVAGRPVVPRQGPGNGDARLQRARVHLQRRPRRAAEDAEAAARLGRQAAARRASSRTCATSSRTPASTSCSRSNPRRRRTVPTFRAFACNYGQ